MSEVSPQPARDIRSLTEGMSRGEESAYRDFFNRYFDRLLRYLLVVSRGQEDAAREAVQRTLERVVRHIRRFDTEDVFWSWLTVLARSAWIDEQRKLGRYLGFLERFFHHQRLEPPLSTDHQSDHHLWSLLERQIGQLPEAERSLIQQKYLDGQAVTAIARQCGCTEKALESRLGRIRRKLKDQVLQELNHENA
jgi:RNA polymerase sigma factor (sigma-70 family)